ncbi:MAG: S1 RNA-binding domain-containing protein [Bacilli bacterium]|nr:S1 RNA-binding domain-containing protein [Bacilli bacterium]
MEEQDKLNIPKVGDLYSGTVVKVFATYAILLFDNGWTGLLHISELSHSYIRSFTSFVTIGTIYNVKVIDSDPETGKIHVSLKQLTSAERRRFFPHEPVPVEEVSFDALKNQLPIWIDQQLKEESFQ